MTSRVARCSERVEPKPLRVATSEIGRRLLRSSSNAFRNRTHRTQLLKVRPTRSRKKTEK